MIKDFDLKLEMTLRVDKLDYMNLKNFLTAKETIHRVTLYRMEDNVCKLFNIV